MAQHQAVSADWILTHTPKPIIRIADMVEDLIDDEVTDLGMELTATCEEFEEGDCDACAKTLDRIKDQIRLAVLKQMIEVKS